MTKEKGFTLYISIVISAAVLLGAYAISNTLFNQQVFSSDYEQSQTAFYMAEAGIECARTYDLNEKAFSISEEYNGTIKCGDTVMIDQSTLLESTIAPNDRAKIGDMPISKFEVHNGDSCAYVSIKKSGVDAPYIAEVESKGYNICDPTASRRIQRAIRARY